MNDPDDNALTFTAIALRDQVDQNRSRDGSVSDTQPPHFWYLSFADPEKPEGQQWLGACAVQANGFLDAVCAATLHGCNPGGQAIGWDLGDWAPVPADFMNRVLSLDDLAEADRRAGGDGSIEYPLQEPT